MKINVPIVSGAKLARNLVRYNDALFEAGVYDDIKEYMKEKLGILNIYDVINPYIIRNTLISVGDKTEGVRHLLHTSEGGWDWEDDYSDELATEIQKQITGSTDDVHIEADEKKDIESAARSILFKDFGYDEYFEHLDLTVFHKLESSSHKATMFLFNKTMIDLYTDVLIACKPVDIEYDRLAVYFAHLIITYISEWDLEDTIVYTYPIDEKLYKEVSSGNMLPYFMSLYNDFNDDEYTPEMKYTIAVIILSAIIFVQNFFRMRGDRNAT